MPSDCALLPALEGADAEVVSPSIEAAAQVEAADCQLSSSAGNASTRLHYIDWLRSLLIGLAVILHVWQSVDALSDHDIMLDNAAFGNNAHVDDWQYVGHDPDDHNGYFWRWITIGRQFVIPLLYSINGAALSFCKGSVAPYTGKVLVITLLGVGINIGLWFAGPQDDSCSLVESLKDKTKCRGRFLDFVVAPHAGMIFAFLFQMWYTIFLLLIIAEDIVLMWFLRLLHERSASEPRMPMPSKAWYLIGLRLVALSALWLGLTRWVQDPTRKEASVQEVLGVLALEVVFDAALAVSAATTASRPRCVRFFQYVAGLTATIQFAFPHFNVWTMDGAAILYYQVFKQFCTLGFTITLTRKKTGPICSRVWPCLIIILIGASPSTNWYRSGLPTYPWYPHLRDRALYIAGGFVWVFVLDRIGRTFAEQSLGEPCPGPIALGTLLTYLFHPIGIACLAPTVRKAYPTTCTPALWSCIVCASILVAWFVPFLATCTRRRTRDLQAP